jgi:methionyl-tRNA formyltransferase
MRIVFLGTGAFAIPAFTALLDAGHDVAMLVTQPDREKGRGLLAAPPPLKPVAEAHGIPVLQPARIKAALAEAQLRELKPDLLVVVAYGQILPRSVLDIPPQGTINVHGSLLPKYRGAAPIQWAIANGETETGVTTMLLDEGLDTGPTLLSRSTLIGPEETAADLEPRLAAMGAVALLDTIRGRKEGTLAPVAQDPSRASLAPILEKGDGRLDWSQPAPVLACRVRGFHPWPGTFTTFEGRLLKILRARPASPGPGEPGTVVGADGTGLLVACAGGSRLRLENVQPESRKPMSAAAFAAGARLKPGAHFV